MEISLVYMAFEKSDNCPDEANNQIGKMHVNIVTPFLVHSLFYLPPCFNMNKNI